MCVCVFMHAPISTSRLDKNNFFFGYMTSLAYNYALWKLFSDYIMPLKMIAALRFSEYHREFDVCVSVCSVAQIFRVKISYKTTGTHAMYRTQVKAYIYVWHLKHVNLFGY